MNPETELSTGQTPNFRVYYLVEQASFIIHNTKPALTSNRPLLFPTNCSINNTGISHTLTEGPPIPHFPPPAKSTAFLISTTFNRAGQKFLSASSAAS